MIYIYIIVSQGFMMPLRILQVEEAAMSAGGGSDERLQRSFFFGGGGDAGGLSCPPLVYEALNY